MPTIHFEDIGASLGRLPQVLQSIPDILRDPSANPVQAAILLAIVLVVVLIVLLSVLIVFIRPSMPEEYLGEGYAEEGEGEEGAAGVVYAASRTRAEKWGTRATVSSVIIFVLVAVWVAAGITTSRVEFCNSCHADSSHANARASDPHANVACTDCHETGGPVARLTVNVATRIEHLVLAQVDTSAAADYGKPAASDGCYQCHRNRIDQPIYDRTIGVRMSHQEPLAAGAQCTDCHAISGGIISAQTVGMSPCLRCHDGKNAKAQCSECHVGDPSGAIRAALRTDMSGVQVPDPQCSGCHVDMTVCNNCHGISMPHSIDFKQFGHARAGALDIWNNNLRTCRKCHYPGHNDCQQPGCHFGTFPSHASPGWRVDHAKATWSGSQTACACHEWNPNDHNGVTFCQICHATKPANAVP